MEIGKKLKEARLNRDLTQEVIAEKLNVSRPDRPFQTGKMKNPIRIL